eukprot:Colp12_sorted_trinity150504_noHs@14660
MSAEGTISYTDTSVHCFDIGDNLQVRVEPINEYAARLYVTDGNGKLQPITRGGIFQLQEIGSETVPPYNNIEFIIVSFSSYVFSFRGVDKLWLNTQNQQTFKAATGITHFMM